MIKVENLSKSFGPIHAVNDISFTVDRGEVLGFLGPNGAGKSTTMRMLTGFIPPSGGKVTIAGLDMEENAIAAKRLIGYLPENAPAYNDMTVKGFLEFIAAMRGFRGAERLAAVRRATETCFLEPVLYQSVDTLSKGYRHRTCLAQAVIHDPDILVLDEPTEGLDPNQKYEVRALIRRMGEKKAIIFSTHILEEVEAACSRAIIIDRGQIVANGTPQELKRMSAAAGAVVLSVRGATGAQVADKLKGLGLVDRVAVEGDGSRTTTVRVFPKKSAAGDGLARGVAETAQRENWQLEELHTEEGRLDEVFRSITMPDTGKELRA
jgi:gliding motility-associated transport system ATP-binding protein